jgi:hypothetical protein
MELRKVSCLMRVKVILQEFEESVLMVFEESVLIGVKSSGSNLPRTFHLNFLSFRTRSHSGESCCIEDKSPCLLIAWSRIHQIVSNCSRFIRTVPSNICPSAWVRDAILLAISVISLCVLRTPRSQPGETCLFEGTTRDEKPHVGHPQD